MQQNTNSSTIFPPTYSCNLVLFSLHKMHRRIQNGCKDAFCAKKRALNAKLQKKKHKQVLTIAKFVVSVLIFPLNYSEL